MCASQAGIATSIRTWSVSQAGITREGDEDVRQLLLADGSGL
jgi:hypothetical protein